MIGTRDGLLGLAALGLGALGAGGEPEMELLPDQGPADAIEVRGVAAGPFRPDWWVAGTLHWQGDARAPLLEPRPGRFRNIYAPMAVRVEGGWRLYYGAWDGVETGNDRIYTAWTPDFLTFEDRHLAIDHGPFVHVCNCCAVRLPDGSFRMVCTAYPHRAQDGLNRPIGFESPDGLVWNGAAPYQPRLEDLLVIEGYEPIENADLNGMNALLFEDGQYRLYYGDFRNFGRVFRASSTGFRRFTLDGVALEAGLAVNDVKRFEVDGERWYLMALHMNREELYYALSRDGLRFEHLQTFARNQSEADRYIVAVGIVTDGVAVYGVLYGAGAVPALNENRLFARWLQKRVVFEAEDGAAWESGQALGPERLLLAAPTQPTTGRFRAYAEDGRTLLYASPPVAVAAGQTWRLLP